MFSLLLTICLTLLIIGIFKERHRRKYCSYEIINGLLLSGIITTAITLFIILVIGACYSGVININERIELYTEENTRIEQQIETAVESYKEYESNTLKEFDFGDNMDVVFVRYPELKTDTLVAEQINLYRENNQKIKELKEEKLSYKISGWWLFFNIGAEYR